MRDIIKLVVVPSNHTLAVPQDGMLPFVISAIAAIVPTLILEAGPELAGNNHGLPSTLNKVNAYKLL